MSEGRGSTARHGSAASFRRAVGRPVGQPTLHLRFARSGTSSNCPDRSKLPARERNRMRRPCADSEANHPSAAPSCPFLRCFVGGFPGDDWPSLGSAPGARTRQTNTAAGHTAAARGAIARCRAIFVHRVRRHPRSPRWGRHSVRTFAREKAAVASYRGVIGFPACEQLAATR